jgi:hypothetical protein
MSSQRDDKIDLLLFKLLENCITDNVRNYNGLGTGDSQVRLNYLKGFTTDHRGGETLIAEDFLPIKDHPFIDGIFIPKGKTVVIRC